MALRLNDRGFQESITLLRQSRTILAILVRDRLLILWILLLGLGIWVGAIVAGLFWELVSSPLHSGVDPGRIWILWLFPGVEGLALASYYGARVRLLAVDQEIVRVLGDGVAARRSFRAVEALERHVADLHRVRQQNVILGVLSALVIIWTGYPFLSALRYAATAAFGVWWIAAFVSPVVIVWLGLSILHRDALSKLETRVERVSVSWPPEIPTQTPATAAAQIAANQIVAEAEELSRRPAGLLQLSEKAVRSLQQQFMLLWTMSFILALGTLFIAATSYQSFASDGFGGGWYDYLFAIEVAGILPILGLVLSQSASGHRPLRRLSAPDLRGSEATTSALGAAIQTIRRASAVLASARRVLESTLAVAVYGVAWPSLCLLFIISPKGEASLFIATSTVLIDCFLVLWFRRFHTIHQDELRVQEWIDGLTEIELEFWSRY